MERKEHKIGERFKDGNTLLETRKGDCPECFYNGNGCEDVRTKCCATSRTDETDVFFKEIKDMEEENSKKEEHFYIWGVPDRGIEVKEMLESKDVNCTLDGTQYSGKDIMIYVEHGTALCINKNIEPSLCELITSNWTELKLPYKPKDKELVLAWNDEEYYKVLGIYCLEWNSIYETKCRMCCYSNYKHYEGEYPQWAKDALSKLEE